MKTLFLLVFIFTTSFSFAQYKSVFFGQQTNQNKNHFLIKDSNIVKRNQDSVKKKYTNDLDNYESRFSAGLGLFYISDNKYSFNTLFSSSLHINLHPITKYLYLAIGADIYIPSDPRKENVGIVINIIPSARINLFRNKLSIFGGAGLCGYISIFPLFGTTISFRAEYNAHEILSLGFEVKRIMFAEDFGDSILLMNHFYMAFKF